MVNRVVVPLDGSALAEKILPGVQKFFEGTPAELHLLQVVMSYRLDPAEEKKERDKLTREAQAYLEKIAADLRAKQLNVQTRVAWGRDAVQICDYAKENHFDLIAMASHGRGGLSRWALGSVADKVLSCSEVPVMLIRVKED